jgi:anti-anti-sigma factor
MSVKCELKNGIVTCVLKGRLDTQSVKTLETELLDAVNDAKSVIFDMEDVEYICSSFIRLCGKVAQDISSFSVSFINLNDDILKILKITGLAKYCKTATYKDM